MNIKQTCKHCDEEMKLTEITTDTGRKVWAYMCSCNEMVREAKEARSRSNGVANNVINPTQAGYAPSFWHRLQGG